MEHEREAALVFEVLMLQAEMIFITFATLTLQLSWASLKPIKSGLKLFQCVVSLLKDKIYKEIYLTNHFKISN